MFQLGLPGVVASATLMLTKELSWGIFDIKDYGLLSLSSWLFFLVTFFYKIGSGLYQYWHAESVTAAGANRRAEREVARSGVSRRRRRRHPLTPSQALVRVKMFVVNVRRWISSDILSPMMSHIHFINSFLESRGHGNLCFGRASLYALRNLRQNMTFTDQRFENYQYLLECVGLTHNQGYILRRLEDFNVGRFINNFRNTAYAMEGIDHPSDAALIFHVFVTYMNELMSPMEGSEVKQFSKRYVIVNRLPGPGVEFPNEHGYAIFCTDLIHPTFFMADNFELLPRSVNVYEAIVGFFRCVKRVTNGTVDDIDVSVIINELNITPANVVGL